MENCSWKFLPFLVRVIGHVLDIPFRVNVLPRTSGARGLVFLPFLRRMIEEEAGHVLDIPLNALSPISGNKWFQYILIGQEKSVTDTRGSN